MAGVLVALTAVALPSDGAWATRPQAGGPGAQMNARARSGAAAYEESLAAMAAADVISNRKPGDEVPELRTANSTTVVSGPSTYRTTMSQEPQNYWTGSTWERIDPTLKDTAAGTTIGANAFSASIASDVNATDLARVRIDPSTSVGWSFAGATSIRSKGEGRGAKPATTPKSSRQHRLGKDTVAFPQAVPGVSIELQSQAQGLKETLVLDSAAASDRYVFPLHLEGLTPSLSPSGDVLLKAGATVKAVIPAGWMEDGSADPEARRAPTGSVTYSLVDHEGAVALEVALERAWLDDPARVYPVRVDPSVNVVGSGSGSPFDDTYAVAGFNNPHQSEATVQTGTNIFQRRGFLHFDMTQFGSSASMVRILDATLRLSLESSQGNCATAPAMQLRRVSETWQNSGTNPAFTIWPGPSPNGSLIEHTTQTCPPTPEVATDPSQRTSYVLASNGNGPKSLADTVQGWLDASIPNYGLALRAQNEAAASEYKKFTSSSGYHGSTSGGYEYYFYPPSLDVEWQYSYLKVSGDSGGPGGAPLTYTALSGSDDCYPEYQTGPYYRPAPWFWGTMPQAQCRADLYWKDPPTANQKTIVLVHPGGWAGTNDSNGVGRRRNADLDRYASAFAEKGYVVAVIDYRQDLFKTIRNIPQWTQNSWSALQMFNLLVHCTQRFEVAGTLTNKATWPPPATLVPTVGAPNPPAECTPLAADSDGNGTPDYDELMAVFQSARTNAVKDVKDAVAWIRNGAGGHLSAASSKVFLVGASAGAITALGANYDPTSTVNGTVAMGGGFIADAFAIPGQINQPAGRQVLSSAAPVQLQIWEYDMTSPLEHDGAPVPAERFSAGQFDFDRQTAGSLRDNNLQVELRGRCGFGHVPATAESQQFDHGVGEALTFLDTLNSGSTPTAGLWFGGPAGSFQKKIGQDLVEDQGSKYRTKVGDFDGNGSSDILWWSPGGGCDAIWFSQGDGTFSRADLSYPVANDVNYARALGKFDEHGSSVPGGQPEQAQADEVSVADFNHDGKADILWYSNGSGDTSAVWYGRGDLHTTDVASTSLFTRRVITPGAGYEHVVSGDFDGDGNQDAYLSKPSGGHLVLSGMSAAPGPDASPVTFSTATVTATATGNVNDPVDGNFTPIAGSFDGDALDDVLLVPPSGSSTNVKALSGTSNAGAFSSANASPPPVYSTVVTGQFNGAESGVKRTDLFWRNAATGTLNAWYGTATQGSFTQIAIGAASTGVYELNVGDFDGDGYSDIYFRGADPTSDLWEGMIRGQSGTGFTTVDQFQQVANDRAGIVGQFGQPTNDSATRDDILWHVSASRAVGGWYWQ